jgi:hypothetical protein
MSPLTAIHYDPRLMEEALFHAQRQSQAAGAYKRQRNCIYEISDPDERERLFDELNRSWFTRLDLDRVIARTVEEQPLINSHIANCFVARAAQATEEGAELFIATDAAIAPAARRTLRILIRPESLLKPEILTPFLRHELLHITDMLDPIFAYEPTLPATEGGPTYDTLITNRYRVLWDVTIDGRMARRGWCDRSIRDRDFRDFLAAFPMLGDGGNEIFQSFFDAAQPRHSELAAFAFNPRAATGHHVGEIAAGTHCSLCRFPSHAFEPAPESLPGEIVKAIQEDFPNWTPSRGLCLQCADLYRARKLSISAAKLLPGWESCAKPDSSFP